VLLLGSAGFHVHTTFWQIFKVHVQFLKKSGTTFTASHARQYLDYIACAPQLCPYAILPSFLLQNFSGQFSKIMCNFYNGFHLWETWSGRFCVSHLSPCSILQGFTLT